jgi:quinol monooxygenase YgiN
MKRKVKLIVFATLASLFWLIPAQAQDEKKDNIARAVMITPKPGHEKTLIEAITEYHHWMANFEGHMEYNWYRIVTGPHTGKFMARTGGHQWADFDAEYDWEEEAGKVFESNVAPHIQEMHVEYTSEMTDFSHWPENFEGYTHYSVQDWYVKNGHYRKFREGLKTIVDALKAGGTPNYWGFFSIASGGHGGQVRLVGANKGWSDMVEKDPAFSSIMIEALGGEDEFHAFMSDWSSTFKSGLNQMVVYMPEASDYGKD